MKDEDENTGHNAPTAAETDATGAVNISWSRENSRAALAAPSTASSTTSVASSRRGDAIELLSRVLLTPPRENGSGKPKILRGGTSMTPAERKEKWKSFWSGGPMFGCAHSSDSSHTRYSHSAPAASDQSIPDSIGSDI